MTGMQEGGFVIATHAVTIIATSYVSVKYLPWMIAKWRFLARNPLGSLVFGFGILMLSAAVQAVYYSSARLHAHMDDAAVGIVGGMWTWAYFVTALQSTNTVAALLALVARWRVEQYTWPQVGLLALRAWLMFSVVWLAVAVWLW